MANRLEDLFFVYVIIKDNRVKDSWVSTYNALNDKYIIGNPYGYEDIQDAKKELENFKQSRKNNIHAN